MAIKEYVCVNEIESTVLMGTLKTWVVSGRHSTKSVFLMNTLLPEARYLDKCTIKICPQFMMHVSLVLI